MRSLILFIILCPFTLFASQDYYVSHTLAYSTTAQKIIQQVNSSNNVFFNFIECELVSDSDGDFEGYSKNNCKLISHKWLYLDEASIAESSRRFNDDLNAKAEGEKFSAVVAATVTALTATISYKLFRAAERAPDLNRTGFRIFGSLFFAFTSVISAGVAYFNYEPSIESILDDSDIIFNNQDEIRKASEQAYDLIKETLSETVNKMGVSLLT